MPRLEPGTPITVQQGDRLIYGYLKSMTGGDPTSRNEMRFEGDHVSLVGPVEYGDIELTIQVANEGSFNRAASTRSEFIKNLSKNIGPLTMTNNAHYYTPEPETESNMERFTASVIGNKSDRTVDIVIEDKDGKFVVPTYTIDNEPTDAPQYDRVDRALGEAVPVFMTLPQEIFAAIKQAD